MARYRRLLWAFLITAIIPLVAVLFGVKAWTVVGEIIIGLPVFIWSVGSYYSRTRKLFLASLWIAFYVGQFEGDVKKICGYDSGALQAVLNILESVSHISQILGDFLGEWIKALVLSPLFPIGVLLMALILFWLPLILVILVNAFVDMWIRIIDRFKE